MSGENNLLNANDKLDYHLQNINRYIESVNCVYATYDESFTLLADMSSYELKNKTQDELFDISYQLYNYAAYLQDELNKHRYIVDFCNRELDLLVAKHRNDYGFDKYTKHDAKKPIIIFENSFAQKIDELRQSAQAKLTVLDGKVYDIKRQADILTEKAKRK